MTSPHRFFASFSVRAGLLAVAAALLVAAPAAAAAPSLEVQLQRHAHERQGVFVQATTGQFKIRFGNATTPDLPISTTPIQLQNALNALPSINAGGGSVSVEGAPQPVGNGIGYLVNFDGGPLANADVPELVGSSGTTPLSGGFRKVMVFTPYDSKVRREERINYTVAVKNVGDAATSGPVSVEVKLPVGLQTSVLTGVEGTGGSGWSCSTQAAGTEPAKALCSRADALAPGASYPRLAVVAALGADAPDHAEATATVGGGGAATVVDGDEFDFSSNREFGIQALYAEVRDTQGADFVQAGGHPFLASTSMVFPSYKEPAATHEVVGMETPKGISLDLPRGFVGNPLAVPQLCASIDDLLASTCPPGSAVGQVNVYVYLGGGTEHFGGVKMSIFALNPEFGLPAQFGFAEVGTINTPFMLSPRLRADDGYGISLDVTPASTFPRLRTVTWGALCGFGARVSGNVFGSCKLADEPDANPKALITNPTRCTGPAPTLKVNATSWEDPGDVKSAVTTTPSLTGCENVDFQPEVSLRPTNQQADAPTGLDVEIAMPTGGLEDPNGRSQANLDNAIVTFPKGMSINPAAAHGLDACKPGQVKLGSNDDDDCPLSSRVGTVELDTPLLRQTLTGHVYLAGQKDNPFNSTIGIYLVFSSKRDGITIKVAGKLEADPVTGQLTSSFVESPEAPFSRLSLHFNEGPRAPLINPPRCGTYAIHSELSPWSAVNPANPTSEEIAAEDSVYQVTTGPNGGPCPSLALKPALETGLQNPIAGSKSAFNLKLTREDGTQRFSALDVSMPAGLTAYLKGVAYCPDHVLAGISGAELTGRPELANPACPEASRVGTVQAGAGAGPFPFYAPGRAYLAGPYKGAPISIAIVTPAVAGPFDLGTVVVRNALYIDPVTARVTVKSDPIPTILHGLFLDVRDIRVNVDRPNFTAAPTNCSPSAVGVRVAGDLGSVANLSNRFQVGDCAALGFKPKLSLRLFGGTKRGAHPKLRAILRARPGDANIAGASVALPHSEFLDQAHIRTICTRVQFAADACPAGAVYGHAEAVTPLLDEPLSGPVYLRSSDNPLPDLVAALRGPDKQPIEVVLAGRVDSVNGGIRNTFDVVPDQPVSTFTLSMQGGKKGLLVNSRNICKKAGRATVEFSAQNGRRAKLRPKLQNSCKKAAKKGKSADKRRSGR